MENLIKKYKEDIKKNALCAERWKGANDSLYTSYMSRNQTLCEVLHDLEREQKQLETQATDLCQSVVGSACNHDWEYHRHWKQCKKCLYTESVDD